VVISNKGSSKSSGDESKRSVVPSSKSSEMSKVSDKSVISDSSRKEGEEKNVLSSSSSRDNVDQVANMIKQGINVKRI